MFDFRVSTGDYRRDIRIMNKKLKKGKACGPDDIPGEIFNQFDEVPGIILPQCINGLSSEVAARVLAKYELARVLRL